jgi:hypothetical protein
MPSTHNSLSEEYNSLIGPFLSDQTHPRLTGQQLLRLKELINMSGLDTGKEALLPALAKATKTRMAYEANVRDLRKPGPVSVSKATLLEMEVRRQKYEPANTDLKNLIRNCVKKYEVTGRR